MIDCSFGSCLLPYLLIKIARHFCLAHRLIRSLYCSVFKESSLFKRLDYLTTIRYFLSSTFLSFLKEDFIGAAALAATGMMIPWMGDSVNWVFEFFVHLHGKVLKMDTARGREGS